MNDRKAKAITLWALLGAVVAFWPIAIFAIKAVFQ